MSAISEERRHAALVAGRVTAGAATLDRLTPGWATLVSLVLLDMCRCSRCVLGQLFGRYEDGIARLASGIGGRDFETPAGAERWSVRHGFNLSSRSDDGENWNILLESWKGEIRKRVAEGVNDVR